MNGMRVNLTFTFTAMGNCFPLVVTVTGLTEWEMSGKDFFHVEIPGLCIGGGGVSINSSKQCGHLFLMRNTEGAEKARFKYYQEKIFIPGINLQRKKYCDFDIAATRLLPLPGVTVIYPRCMWSRNQLSSLLKTRSSQTNRMQLAPVLSSQPILRLCSESSRRSNQHTWLGTYQWIDAP